MGCTSRTDRAALLGVAVSLALAAAAPPAMAQAEEKTFAELGVDPAAINGALTQVGTDRLQAWLGAPADSEVGSECVAAGEAFAARLTRVKVGTTEAVLIAQAADSVAAVMARIEAQAPDLHARIGSIGGLCIRTLRGSDALSVHSFGTSLDIAVDGVIDTLGDGKTSAELAQLATYFAAEGWYWGGAFPREDSMHFEASRELVDRWIAAGP